MVRHARQGKPLSAVSPGRGRLGDDRTMWEVDQALQLNRMRQVRQGVVEITQFRGHGTIDHAPRQYGNCPIVDGASPGCRLCPFHRDNMVTITAA